MNITYFGHSAKPKGAAWHTHSRPINGHSHSVHHTNKHKYNYIPSRANVCILSRPAQWLKRCMRMCIVCVVMLRSSWQIIIFSIEITGDLSHCYLCLIQYTSVQKCTYHTLSECWEWALFAFQMHSIAFSIHSITRSICVVPDIVVCIAVLQSRIDPRQSLCDSVVRLHGPSTIDRIVSGCLRPVSVLNA